MDLNQLAKSLHQLEVRVLRRFKSGEELDSNLLEKELGYKTGQSNQAFSWLCAKALARESKRVKKTFYEFTEFGREQLKSGTAEEKILTFLQKNGSASVSELCAALGLDNKDAGSAYGQFSKEGVLSMDADKKLVLIDAGKAVRTQAIRALMEKASLTEDGLLDDALLSDSERAVMAGIAKKRGAQDSLFRTAEREIVYYLLENACAGVRDALVSLGITGEELGPVTQAMLSNGTWKNLPFRAYNISVPPARVLLGRRNPYCKFLENVKDKLVSLGFEEFDGGLIETDFWNSDALFMPQFHAARDIHDVYYVKDPVRAKTIEEPWLSNVAATHKNGGSTGSRGWGYDFDENFTKRLILRSQGTVLSARQLPTAKIPGKYFGIARCFRYDRVDATHLSDFYQTEGIVLGDEVNLRTLLGFLKMFAMEVAGAKEVKYVPGYFPFTEPSVEVHIKHPVLGWFELGGAGIFRPEVSEALGVKVPVLAWGIGIDRMALMALGLNDIRDLFSPDIENIRLRRSKA